MYSGGSMSYIVRVGIFRYQVGGIACGFHMWQCIERHEPRCCPGIGSGSRRNRLMRWGGRNRDARVEGVPVGKGRNPPCFRARAVPGTLTLCLRPPTTKPPFFGGVEIYLISPPELDFDFTGAANIGDWKAMADSFANCHDAPSLHMDCEAWDARDRFRGRHLLFSATEARPSAIISTFAIRDRVLPRRKGRGC